MGVLKGLIILNDLSNNEINQLSHFCQERGLEKGEKLFNEGDEANSLYFIKKGAISVYKEINSVNTYIGEIGAENILGEMSIFGGNLKRNASAIANQATSVVVIMSFSIKDIANKNPTLLKKIQDIIKFRIMNNKIIASNNKKKN